MEEKKYYAHTANAKGDRQALKGHLRAARRNARAARPGGKEFADAGQAAMLRRNNT